MRFVSRGARIGKRNSSNDLAVTVRVLVKIDHCKEVGIDSGLISRPNEKILFVPIMIGTHGTESWFSENRDAEYESCSTKDCCDSDGLWAHGFSSFCSLGP